MIVIIITNAHGDIFALDSNSLNVITSCRRTCNDSALRQVICDVQMRGYCINWTASTVARPADIARDWDAGYTAGEFGQEFPAELRGNHAAECGYAAGEAVYLSAAN